MDLKKYIGIFRMVGVATYLVLVAFGFAILQQSGTGQAVASPWHTIQPSYIYVFFAATLLLGLLLWSCPQFRLALFLLVVHSCLLHSYLPLTHNLVYGADQWRHMAVESRLLQGLPELKATLADGSRAGFEVGDLAYSGLWGLTVLITKLFGTSLIVVNKWLLPVIWSISFPFLLFLFGRELKMSDEDSLWLVWFSFFPFALTVNGSLTLPVGLGFLVWLASLVILLKKLNDPAKISRWWLVGLTALLVFNYTLYLILFLVAWAVVEVLLRVQERVTWWRYALPVVAVALVLPTAEWLGGFSMYNPALNIISVVKQIVGNFTGFYLALGPQPHTIAAGNIIINQIPLYNFVPNLFTLWRWWIPVTLLAFWGFAKYGVWRSVVNRDIPVLLVSILGNGLLVGYLLSRYFLVGEQVLSRRLDVVLAFLFIVLFSFGLQIVRKKYVRTSVVWFVFILLFSAFIAASYSLGPDTRAVSTDEYRAMAYIWAQEKNNASHCVLAETYQLLALEAISNKEIIGGGFPINRYFAQPERELLLTSAVTNPAASRAQALSLTKSDHCWVVWNVESSYVPPLFMNMPQNDFNFFGPLKVFTFDK